MTEPAASGHREGVTVAAGTRHAGFRAFYEEWADYVFRLLRRLGVRETDLDDATQDTFVVAAGRFDEFTGGSARAWVTAIAVRVASNHRRRPAYRREELDDEAGHATADRAPGADDRLAQRDARRLVQRALAKLPEPQREVFVLHEIEGFPVPDIARMTGVALNTQYSRLRLGREAFERAVQELAAGRAP